MKYQENSKNNWICAIKKKTWHFNSLIHSLIHSFIHLMKFLLDICFVPETELGPGEANE